MKQGTQQADEEPGHTQGAGKRLDAALTARGFTTWRLRVRAAAVLSVFVVGVSWFLLYRLTNVGGPDSVCDGAATAGQVHDVLGSGRISEHKREKHSTMAASSGYSCSATVNSGLFETTKRTVWFTIALDTKGPHGLAAPDARLFSGGSVGSVTPQKAWALLPEGCDKGLRAEVETIEEGRDETRARLAVAFANRAAKANRCADQKLPMPKSLSAKGAEAAPNWAELCGLPGFAPAKDPEAQWPYQQQVTTASDPIWSCTITRRSLGTLPQTFAITTEPRTTALDQKEGARPSEFGRAHQIGKETPAELVVACHGRDVFFSVDGGYEPTLDKHYLFPDQKDLMRQFLTAGGKAIGCEPIL
ncbi:hypothetical protein [Kitasatospora sp. NPDC091276]|uniref:hypothetical protein n=1 Tax=Kitasatospora sp. NPDC091276 TaxID=3155300 RepID=UPI0034340829